MFDSKKCQKKEVDYTCNRLLCFNLEYNCILF